MIFKFGKVTSPQCCFCKLHNETIYGIDQMKSILLNNLLFPKGATQSAIFRFWDLETNQHLTLNHLLLILTMYIYIAKTTGYSNISHILIYVKGIKDTEKKLQWKMVKCFKELTEVT